VIAFAANDGTATSAAANKNVTITAQNDAPVLTTPVSVNATEDVAFGFTAGNTISVTDVDSGAGTNFQATLAVSNGTISATPAAGLTIGGNGTNNVTLTGTVTVVNTALGTVTYTGNLNFNGTDTMSVNVTDNGQTGTGPVGTDSASITINVGAVNDPPVAQNKNFSAQAHMRINGLTGLLTGVTDPDDGTGTPPCSSTTFTVVSITPVTGGTVPSFDGTTGTFDFQPAAGFTGNATLNYVVEDTGCPGTAQSAPATITIAVSGPIIYFVKSAAVGTGDCTLGNECTLATAVTNIGANTGRHIFISDANTHTPGVAINLNSGGRIKGQGVTPPVDSDGVLTDNFDDLFDITPPTGTIARPGINLARPTIQNSTLTLHLNSHARGFNMAPNANGLVATGRTGLKVTDMSITSTSNNAAQWAVDLGTSSGEFTFGTITVSNPNAGSGVRFATTTSASPVTIGNISVQGGQGFNASSTGTTNFTLSNVSSTSGAAVTTTTTSSGDFTFGTVTSTTGTAVSVATATGDFIFTAINSNGAVEGVSVNGATGSFTVNGSGTTDGSGGTIQNGSGRGVEFISSNNITLRNMNLDNNATGGSDANCGDALGATTNASFITNATCEANLHLQTVTTVTLNNLNVTDSDAHGISGIAVNGLTMTDMLVELNGNEVGEDGVQFVNSSGTITVNGTNTFRDNAANQFEAQNGSGTVTYTISGSFFGLTNFPTTGAAEAPSPGATTANNGLQISASGTANMTASITGSTFDENYANGYLSDTFNSAAMTITVGTALSGNAFTNNGVPIEIVNASTGAMTYTLRNNTITNNTTITGTFATTAITAARSGAGSLMTGTIDDNVIGTQGGAVASGCFVTACVGISLPDSATSNANRYNITVTNNQIHHVQGGITSNIGGGGGSPTTSFVITGNTVGDPDAPAQDNAIHINSGTLPASTPQTCVEISGNTLNGAWGVGLNNDSLRLRHRGAAGSTFRVRNWDGLNGATPGLENFLESTNTFGGGFVDGFGFQLVGTNVFTGGAGACP
jgi:hypothetical protein